MTPIQKTAMLQNVLDELSTVGYLTSPKDKTDSLDLIRELLKDFEPQTPTTEAKDVREMKLRYKTEKVDVSIHAMKLIAFVNNGDLNKQLEGLALLAEKALSEMWVIDV